jgi:multiple sugar transport system permease protein
LVYPLWYLAGLVALWMAVPPLACIGADLLQSGKKRLSIRHKQWFWASVFMGVSLAWATLFLFIPLAQALGQSLTDFSLTSATSTRWVGLRNYRSLLSDPFWWHTVAVTLIYMAATVPVGILISLFLAVQILKQPKPLQTFFKAALYLPGVISMVVGAAVMKWIFHSGDGFANAVLHSLGIAGRNWFGDPSLAMPVLIVMSWLSANGVGVIIYAAAVGNIPATYYEVARIDGASSRHMFIHITWPLVKPTTIYVAITGLIAGFQVFAPALLITGGGPLKTTYFLNYHIYRTFYYENNFGLASAMAVVLMGFIVALSVINYRWLATDVEY